MRRNRSRISKSSQNLNLLQNLPTTNGVICTHSNLRQRKSSIASDNLSIASLVISKSDRVKTSTSSALEKEEGDCKPEILENQMNLEKDDDHRHTEKIRNINMKPSNASVLCNNLIGIAIRVILFVIFIRLECTPPFKRKIQPEELWLYKYPPTNDYVPASVLLPASFVVPFTVICINFLISHDRYDFTQANNVVTLSLGITAVLTSLLKVTIGRPRPDFFYRCFPDGVMTNDDMDCVGDQQIVNEGRKSFPSGHSSFAFAGFGFVSLYLAGKLNIFNEKGRGQPWRLCLALFPLVVAALVAISRTCDYHHHWQDVLIGSFLGFVVTFICYRQYYPSIFAGTPEYPYSNRLHVTSSFLSVMEDSVSISEQKSLIEEEKDTKWI